MLENKEIAGRKTEKNFSPRRCKENYFGLYLICGNLCSSVVNALYRIKL